MKKTIVIYYSRKGSNKYLAQKIAKSKESDIAEIKPRTNIFIFLLFLSSFGIKKLRSDINEYDRIILCGPIWMGKFISPLESFVNKYKDNIKELVFVSCCGSSYEVKEEKFGHGLVFKLVEEIMGNKCSFCEAFPIGLVVPEDKQKDSKYIMKTRLSDENFTGEIQDRFDNFILKLA